MEPIRVYDNPPRDAWPALTARVTRDDAEIDRRVAAILNEVRTGGDEALRRRMVADGRAWVARFEPEVIASELLSTYRKVLAL